MSLTKVTYAMIEGAAINVLDYGATGDGVTNDAVAIQAAINAMSASGGGTVYFPSGRYYIEAPIEFKSYVNIVGENQQSTVIYKNNTATVGGIDCVVYALNCTRFNVSNIGVDGMTTSGTTIASAHSFGFYLRGCSYFDLSNTKARYCLVGYRFHSSFIGGIAQSTAQQCLQYGFITSNSCTSLVFRNTTSFGCGGGWSLQSTVYTQLIGCACDLSDAGGSPGDPFLPFGSGGNYQAAAFIFQLIASQGITIISPGCENSYSQYIYAEGGYVTVISPYIFNLQCYDPTWNFIATRQTGASQITIINTFGIETNVINQLSASPTIRGIYVETPAVQSIKILGELAMGSSFGAYAYVGTNIDYVYGTKVCDYTQQSMVIGASSSFIYPATNISSVSLSGTTKELIFDAVTANAVTFDQPLPSVGIFQFNITGTYSSSFGLANLALIETDGVTTNTLKSWTNSSGSISIQESAKYEATAGYSLFFRIVTNNTTDVMKFTNFQITVGDYR
jgi:hypothetical protein